VVGASAGGVEALRDLVRALPAELHAALFVVLHMPPDGQTLLPAILSRAGPLPAHEAVDGEPIRHGHIYVARPNHHLLIERERVRVMIGPHENALRPAADPLFRSAAYAYGERVVGIVLSGSRDDGAAGLYTIKRHGGLAVVQHPDEALFPGMPLSALELASIDYVLPVAQIGALVGQLARLRAAEGRMADMTDATTGAGRADDGSGANQVPAAGPSPEKREGEASGLTCPECRGSLWEVREGDNIWFECRVDHRYSFQSMLAEQARTVEAAIWAAINVLEERAALMRKQATRADERGHEQVARRFAEQAVEADAHAQAIRTQLLSLVQTLGTTAE
jgi:two-component system chemotaxis response regulator CheB